MVVQQQQAEELRLPLFIIITQVLSHHPHQLLMELLPIVRRFRLQVLSALPEFHGNIASPWARSLAPSQQEDKEQEEPLEDPPLVLSLDSKWLTL